MARFHRNLASNRAFLAKIRPFCDGGNRVSLVLSAAVWSEGGGESFFGLGADAEVCVGFGEDYASSGTYHVGCGKGQAPAWFSVDEGNVDEDGLVIGAVIVGDGVDEAELLGKSAAGIGEHGERQPVLAGHEVALAFGLRADGNH